MIVGCSAGPTKFYTKEQDSDLTIDVNMDILWRLDQDEALTSMPKVIFLDLLRSPTTICGFRTEMEPGIKIRCDEKCSKNGRPQLYFSNFLIFDCTFGKLPCL